MCEKPTPSGVGWIAQTIQNNFNKMCINLFTTYTNEYIIKLWKINIEEHRLP